MDGIILMLLILIFPFLGWFTSLLFQVLEKYIIKEKEYTIIFPFIIMILSIGYIGYSIFNLIIQLVEVTE